jgi:hypothetical protein
MIPNNILNRENNERPKYIILEFIMKLDKCLIKNSIVAFLQLLHS